VNEIQPIEHNGQRVLTTQQLADHYGTTDVRIRQNYNQNLYRYKEGVHFFRLADEDLRAFRHSVGNSYSVEPQVNQLILWTEKGALLHAKSLNTDTAWEIYEYLVDHYFRTQVRAPVLSTPESRLLAVAGALRDSAQAIAELRAKQDAMETTLHDTHQQTHYLEARLKDTQRGLVDINKPLRDQFNKAVRDLAHRTGLLFNAAYDRVYETLEAQEHSKIRLRAEHAGVRPIEIMERNDLLVKGIRLAKAM